MAQAALIASAAGSAIGGMAAYSKAKADKQAADINSYIGRTRAVQTATSAADNLRSETGELRTTLATNGQSVGSAFGIFDELRRARGRDRRVAYANEMQASRDYAQQGRNAMSAGRWGLAQGLVKAGPSMFDLYQLRGG